MKFLIRDDDTCAFTTPKELEKCYGHIWDEVPVNLSVTPFRVPGDSETVPKAFRGHNEPIPLGLNKELVDFLKEKIKEGNVHIAMHGYNHTKPKGLPEYVGGENLFEKTKEGKQYIEDLLGCSVDTFVPPNNGIAREGLRALVSNGLNLVSIPPLLRPNYRTMRLSHVIKYIRLKYYSSLRKIQYPYVFHFDDHKEVSYYSVTPSQSLDVLLRGFEGCKSVNGVFIFAVHYHAFQRRLKTGEIIRDVLNRFLDMTSMVENIQYLKYDELWRDEK